MSTQKEQSSKPETSEPQPKAPQSGELDEKQLDKAVGGTGGTTTVPHAPIGPGPTG
jgi:hypothetical protein